MGGEYPGRAQVRLQQLDRPAPTFGDQTFVIGMRLQTGVWQGSVRRYAVESPAAKTRIAPGKSASASATRRRPLLKRTR